MRHTTRPCVEPLEGRSLLSAAAATPPVAASAASTSSLQVTVTTDHAVYVRGEPVRITVTEKNLTNHDVPVLIGCQILNASASHNGATVWRYRDMRECATGRGVLHAGQSRQFTVVWNGRSDVSGTRFTTGWVVLHGSLDGVQGTAVVRVR